MSQAVLLLRRLRERHRHRHRDSGEERGWDRDQHRVRDQELDWDGDQDQDQDQYHDRDRDQHRDQHRAQHQDLDGDRDQHRDRARHQDRHRDEDHEGDRRGAAAAGSVPAALPPLIPAAMRPGIKLFVGNVPEEASAEELSELFSGVAGPVLGVALMKQFAFVHLRDEAAAARAISQLNGHQLHGRRIVVEPSRPRPTNTCKIFVGNVSAACTSGELRSLFQQYGPVVECDVVKDYAFVHMENEADAKVAIENLNGKEVKGRRVNVELSTNVQKKGTGQAPPPALGVDKTKRIGLEYREKFQPKIEGFDQQRRAADAAFPSAAAGAGYATTPSLYDYQQRFGAKYDAFDAQPRPASPSYFGRDRSPLRRSPTRAGYAAVTLPMTGELAAGSYGAQPMDGHAGSYGAQPGAALSAGYSAQAVAVHASSYSAQAVAGHAAAAYQPVAGHSASYGAQPALSASYGAQPTVGHSASYGAQPAAGLPASYGGGEVAAHSPVSDPVLRRLCPSRCVPGGRSGRRPPWLTPSLFLPRYGSERRLSELADYRRLADSPLAYRRSPTKSPLDYRRLPDAHSEYARYSGGYGDYMPPARVHSGYQRRL
ncbi:PREDICTED: RNA-binding protein 14 [Ficedula albicollis]|uniref:RNA-binding protein 14 n=1 Tax=Ficedula albicollis TaxID=59894 RepID=UPI0007AD79E3|nr:PREDICTED: RNA-binding protein 14 [Ficedula albicollis]